MVERPVTSEAHNKLQELVELALELDPEARRIFISQACGELRPQVEKMLAAYQKSANFLEKPLMRLGEDGSLKIGTRLGPYQLNRAIGEGGMGSVYLAERADQQYQQTVSIKVIRRDLASAELIKRFCNERQILADLNHPYIARLLDGGTTDEGFPYLVMEYIEGLPIDQYCTQQKLPLEERLKLFIKVCEGVKAAHQKRIVHRDLKPNNILVTAEGTPRLLDFGIAKLVTEQETEFLDVTHINATQIFTPRYSSPEQINAQSSGYQSDIYSLGVILYELLTGQMPHGERGQNVVDLLALVREGIPVPPSQAQITLSDAQERGSSPSKLSKQLQGDLDAIILKALSKEPENRYASIDVLIKEVQRFLNDEPVEAMPQTLIYLTRKYFQRNRMQITVGILVGLSVTGIFFGKSIASLKPPGHSVAVLSVGNRYTDPQTAYFSDGITEDITIRLGKIGQLTVISDAVMRPYKNSQKPLQTIADELNVATIATVGVRRITNQVHINISLINPRNGTILWGNEYDRPLKDVFAIQREVSQKIADGLRLELLPEEQERIAQQGTASLSAYDYYLKGREFYNFYRKQDNEQAIKLFKKALQLDSNYALAYAGLGDAYAQRFGKFGFSKASLEEAVKASEKSIDMNPKLAEGYKALGLAYLLEGKLAKALIESQTAISFDPNNASATSNYGLAKGYLGDWAGALPFLKKAYSLSPTQAYQLTNLAEAYMQMSLDIQAIEWYTKAIALQVDTSHGYNKLSYLYLMQGNLLLAEQAAKQCLDVSPSNPSCYIAMGDISLYQGNLKEAYNYYQKLTSLPEESDRYIVTLGYLQWKLGRKQEAMKLFTSLIKRGKKFSTTDSQDHETTYALAKIYSILESPQEANFWLKKSIDMGWRNYRDAITSPIFESMRNDIGFQALMKSLEEKTKELQRRAN
jgi:eukaryotic-like serine/threonine-protein kinase